jgi:hypothetical protein
VTTARMQEVEQRREQLPRGNSNKEKSLFKSPHPSLLPEGEGARTLKSTVLGAELTRRNDLLISRYFAIYQCLVISLSVHPLTYMCSAQDL